MSDTTTQPDPQPQDAPDDDGLVDAPEDAPTQTATGYALYDRTIGQYVGSVVHQKAKPSEDKFPSLPDGHTGAIVRV